jgi:hypothetical protein
MAARITSALISLLLVAATLTAQQDSTAADSSAGEADSSLARVDSTMVTGETTAGEDYMAVRESYRYPRTGRNDPFNLPIGQTNTEVLGPVLSELKLTGVIYTPDGPRIAILGQDSGESFLIREGDRLGVAELVLIEKTYVMFSIEEFGRVRDYVIELQPLLEEKDGQSPINAGNGGRQEESEEQADRSQGGSPEND